MIFQFCWFVKWTGWFFPLLLVVVCSVCSRNIFIFRWLALYFRFHLSLFHSLISHRFLVLFPILAVAVPSYFCLCVTNISIVITYVDLAIPAVLLFLPLVYPPALGLFCFFHFPSIYFYLIQLHLLSANSLEFDCWMYFESFRQITIIGISVNG